eukprot:6208049-Pleurochrysis_carterae.AAC.6
MLPSVPPGQVCRGFARCQSRAPYAFIDSTYDCSSFVFEESPLLVPFLAQHPHHIDDLRTSAL